DRKQRLAHLGDAILLEWQAGYAANDAREQPAEENSERRQLVPKTMDGEARIPHFTAAQGRPVESLLRGSIRESLGDLLNSSCRLRRFDIRSIGAQFEVDLRQIEEGPRLVFASTGLGQ